jgi:hypothetical protein
MQNYVRNETKKLIQKGNSVAVIKITGVKLNNHLLKLPGTKVFCRLLYADQEFSNRSRNPDLNFSIFEIRLHNSLEVHVKVFIKGLLVNEKEVGNCQIKPEDFEERLLKKELLLEGSNVGSIDLVLSTFNENLTISTQSTCNSLDMRDDFQKDSSHLDLDSLKPLSQFCQIPDTESRTDESFDEKSTEQIFEFIQKVSAKKSKILTERKALESFSRNLQVRSENLSVQKLKLDEENEIIKDEKMRIEKNILTLNQEFYGLKKQQFKNRAHKKMVLNGKAKVAACLNRFRVQDKRDESNKENIEYCVMGLLGC